VQPSRGSDRDGGLSFDYDSGRIARVNGLDDLDLVVRLIVA